VIRLRTKHAAIVPIDDPETTPGGIIIPDQAKDRTDQGIVKYVGADCEFVSPLDYVIYGGFNGQLLIINTERLIVVHEDFITARVSTDDVDSLEVAGLYYKSRDGGFTSATYETAVEFLARTIENSPWFQDKRQWNVREVSERSKPSQYRVMQETRDG
jgi:co-chaperonin GroES (HSP10)